MKLRFLSNGTAVSFERIPKPIRIYFHSSAKPLRVLSAGICLGEAKGKDFIPSQELALSTALTPNAFPSVELEWEDAIKFLKKEALVLPSGTDKGYVLVRYQGLPLGFVKNLGNRANNPVSARVAYTDGIYSGGNQTIFRTIRPLYRHKATRIYV